jgi:hypothetical protein
MPYTNTAELLPSPDPSPTLSSSSAHPTGQNRGHVQPDGGYTRAYVRAKRGKDKKDEKALLSVEPLDVEKMAAIREREKEKRKKKKGKVKDKGKERTTEKGKKERECEEDGVVECDGPEEIDVQDTPIEMDPEMENFQSNVGSADSSPLPQSQGSFSQEKEQHGRQLSSTTSWQHYACPYHYQHDYQMQMQMQQLPKPTIPSGSSGGEGIYAGGQPVSSCCTPVYSLLIIFCL